MSKLFNMEPPRDPQQPELARKFRQEAESRVALDAEAALHMELLAETDAKLDRVNARLDRFSAELNRATLAQGAGQAETQHQQRAADISSERRSSPLLTVFGLLMFGIISGSAYTAWQYTVVPVESEPPSEPLALALPSMEDQADALSEPLEVAMDEPQIDMAPPPAQEPQEAQVADDDARSSVFIQPTHGQIRM